ncbi:ABC transporter permease [bacterium]|nr:ABC transporter permease [bacterium]
MRIKSKPPLLAIWLFRPLMPKEDRPFLINDFEEMFEVVAMTEGRWQAIIWSWKQYIGSTPHFLKDHWYWSCAMLKNLFKIGFRNIAKQRLSSVLNVAGLAVALAAAWVLIFHVQFETSFENWNPNSQNVCRIAIKSKYGDTYRHWANGPVLLSQSLKEQIPDIQDYTRFNGMGNLVVSAENENGQRIQFSESGGYFVDATVFDLFNLKLVSGDLDTVFDDLSSVVLTQSMARRYFGNEDPIGKILDFEGGRFTAIVTGVIEDLPANTFLSFDYLVPMDQLLAIFKRQGNEAALTSRTWKAMMHFVKMRPGYDQAHVEALMVDFQKEYHADEVNRVETFTLQPIQTIHLHSKLNREMSQNGDIIYIYVFSAIAIVILLLASLNFINISIAQSMKRIREVGLRKVLGAQRSQLMGQFIGETYLLIFLATLLAALLVALYIPMYNQVTAHEFTFSEFMGMNQLGIIGLVVIVIGLLAGLYPAFYISQFQLSASLKKGQTPTSSVSKVRSGLVIFQFVISIFMIFATLTISRQLTFFKQSGLGFEKERIISVRLQGAQRQAVITDPSAFRNELLSSPDILNVSLVSRRPGVNLSIEHLRLASDDPDADVPTVRFLRADENYLETLKVPLVEGENFRKQDGGDYQFLLNESAVEALGLVSPVGKRVRGYSGEGEIKGIFKDYHFESLKKTIEPMVIEYRSVPGGNLLIKYAEKKDAVVLDYIKQQLDTMVPNQILNYQFVEDHLNSLYIQEDRLGSLFRMFSGLAIFISCLGLFGISAHYAQLRNKEIGIRKVMGATAPNVVVSLIKQYVIWIGIANIIAWPVAYLVMGKWLENFAYRISIDIWTCLAAGFTSLAVAIITVTYRSIRASLADPVQSLRHE